MVLILSEFDFRYDIRNKEIQSVFFNEKYAPANDIIQSVLKKEMPSDESLKLVYGENIDYIKKQTDFFINSNISKLGSHIRINRQTPQKIADAIEMFEKESEMRPYFEESENALFSLKIPTNTSLNKIYGCEQFSLIARNIIMVYQENREFRESGIPKINHPYYLSALAKLMGFREKQIIAALAHDFCEDNLNKSKDVNGKVYDLFRYEEFNKKYLIDDKIIDLTTTFTNFTSLILKQINMDLKKQNYRLNRSNLVEQIDILRRSPKLSRLEDYFDNIIHINESYDIKSNLEDAIKEIAYDKPYMNNLTVLCEENPDLYGLKGLDVTFNGIQKNIPDIYFAIRNIKKQVSWVNNGYALGNKNQLLNDMIEEVAQNALVSAYYIVLKLMYNNQFKNAHHKTTLSIINNLRPVFFTDVGLDSIIV